MVKVQVFSAYKKDFCNLILTQVRVLKKTKITLS